LQTGGQFLMGDKFTSADILLTTCLDWAIAYGVGIATTRTPISDAFRPRQAYQLAKAANVPLAPIVFRRSKSLT